MHGNKFKDLTPEEYQIAIETPLYISLLIATADGNVNKREAEWMNKVLYFRTKTAHHTLIPFYEDAHDFISKNLDTEIENLPASQYEKMKYLSEKIARFNEVLPKFDEAFKQRILGSFRSLAMSVATVDSGIFGFFRQNPTEEKWLHLDMIKDGH